MRSFTLHLCLVITFLIIPVFGFSQAPPPPPGGFPDNHGLPVNSQIPDVELTTLGKQLINLDDESGHFLLIDFWGTWCEPCLEDMPYLKQAHLKYGEKLKIIGIAADTEERVVNFLRNNDLPWDQVVTDFGSKIINTFNVQLYPTKILISPTGKILNGATSQEDMDKLKGEQIIKTLDVLIQ